MLPLLFFTVLINQTSAAEDAADAKKFYEAAVRAQPKNANAQYDLANVYFMEGRYADALAHYLEAGSLGLAAARLERYYLNLSACYSKLGRNDDAIRAIESCIKMNPSNSSAQELLKIYQGREAAEKGF